jgi:hypothetical protein
MSEQLKLRGDTATNLASFTPAQRECVVDITNNRLCVGDGSTANGWPLAKLSEGAWTVSTGIMQCVLSQRTVITSEPVPTLRPTAANMQIALDVMPNGAPGGSAIAWVDICDADCYASTSTPVNFLHLAANSTALQIASSSLYGGTGKPLTFVYGSTEIFRLNSVGLGVGVGGNAFHSPFTVSTNAAALPAGVGVTTPLAQFGAVDGGVPRVLIDGFGNNPVLDLRAANGTAASPTALTTGTTIGQVNFDGYNGSAYVNVTASLTIAAAENWTTGAHGTYFSVYVTIPGGTTLVESLRIVGNQIEFKAAQADQSKVDVSPSTGFSQTIANNCTTLLLKPSGTLASGTVVMPAAPVDGQIAHVLSSQTITSLTVSPSSGQSVVGAPSTTGPSAPFSMIYDLASTTWYRT